MSEKKDPDELETEQVQELMDFLKGDWIPDGMIFEKRPKLKAKQAFAIVYFLQEHMHILPDCFEMCVVCNSIFDTTSEGYVVGEYDDFHESVEVSPQEVEEHEGTPLCSRECELKFWRSL
jgi:SAM-dependent MidA family methyltransferase